MRFQLLFKKCWNRPTGQSVPNGGKSGERLAVIPPYGYRKDENDPKQLIIDEESAATVRRIFRLSVEGHGPAQIARLLNGEHVLNLSSYKYEHGILKKARPCKDPYFWNTTHKLHLNLVRV